MNELSDQNQIKHSQQTPTSKIGKTLDLKKISFGHLKSKYRICNSKNANSTHIGSESSKYESIPFSEGAPAKNDEEPKFNQLDLESNENDKKTFTLVKKDSNSNSDKNQNLCDSSNDINFTSAVNKYHMESSTLVEIPKKYGGKLKKAVGKFNVFRQIQAKYIFFIQAQQIVLYCSINDKQVEKAKVTMGGNEIANKKKKRFLPLFRRKSPPMRLWDLCISIPIFYYIAIDSIKIAFGNTVAFENKTLWPNYFFHPLFVTEMLLSMYFVTEETHTNLNEISRTSIFKNYIKYHALLDIIPFFPFHLWINELLFVEFIRLRFLVRTKINLEYFLKFIITRISNRASKALMYFSLARPTFMLVLTSFAIIHLLTCFWIFISRINENDINGTSITLWINNFSLENQKKLIYLEALRFVIGSLVKIGLLNLSITTLYMMIVAMTMNFFGTIILSYIVKVLIYSYNKSKTLIPLQKLVTLLF